MTSGEILKRLESLANAENVTGMARFGIKPKKAFGIFLPEIKNFAKEIGKNHSLAQELWQTEYHEARFLACLIDNPKEVTPEQMDAWAEDFDNWAICDSCCGHLFRRINLAYAKVFEWSGREEEFVKRAGIVLAAWLAVHDKKRDDEFFIEFLDLLEQKSDDERNLIKKAVSWSLRQIGKRNSLLNRVAVETANRIKTRNTKVARWITADVLRELPSEKVQDRLRKKAAETSQIRNPKSKIQN